MAFDSKGLDTYVDVNQRIADFREQYPNGSLQPIDPAHPWEQATVTGVAKNGDPFTATMIVYTAAAYRTPDDQRPGIGVAWEVFPGRTPYTLGSELMNAETSAWGRAIVAALASDSKRGVSSREEVRNRRAEHEGMSPEVVAAVVEDTNRHHREAEALMAAKAASEPQRKPVRADPEHERLVHSPPSPTEGPHPGTTRTRNGMGTEWDDQPAGPFDAASVTPEDVPGSIDSKQRSGIMAALSRLGVKDRDGRLDLVASIVGHPVETTNDLTYSEAAKVQADLQGRKVAAK